MRNYIRKQCEDVDITKEGYYGDVKKAVDNSEIELGAIATTNCMDIIEKLTGQRVHFLNGSTEKISNKPRFTFTQLEFQSIFI